MIATVEKENVIPEDSQLIKIITKYFANIVKNLDLPRENNVKLDNGPVKNTIKAFEIHPSTIKIKGRVSILTLSSLVLIMSSKKR